MEPEIKTENQNFTCSNPKCRRAFANPITVQNLCSEGVPSYCACPHCLTEIKETPDDEGRKQQDKSESTELRQVETLPIEKKPALEPSETNRCSQYLGYLSQLSGGKETPDECMICEKLIECKLSNFDSAPPRIEPKNMLIEEGKQSVEDSAVDTGKKELEETMESETKTEPLPTEFSGNQFEVENLGMLYASWHGTVCINKETLSGWGGKIKEVDIETNAGKKTRCHVMPSEDSRKGIIMIPDKMQITLEINKGELVRVQPVIVLEKESKRRISPLRFLTSKKLAQN